VKLDYATPGASSHSSDGGRFSTGASILIFVNALASLAVLVPSFPSLASHDAGLISFAGSALMLVAIFAFLSRTPPRIGRGLLLVLAGVGIELVAAYFARRQIAGIEAQLGAPISSLSAKTTQYAWLEYAYDALRVALALGAILALYLFVRLARRLSG
jgi:hypothetical protein